MQTQYFNVSVINYTGDVATMTNQNQKYVIYPYVDDSSILNVLIEKLDSRFSTSTLVGFVTEKGSIQFDLINMLSTVDPNDVTVRNVLITLGYQSDDGVILVDASGSPVEEPIAEDENLVLLKLGGWSAESDGSGVIISALIGSVESFIKKFITNRISFTDNFNFNLLILIMVIIIAVVIGMLIVYSINKRS